MTLKEKLNALCFALREWPARVGNLEKYRRAQPELTEMLAYLHLMFVPKTIDIVGTDIKVGSPGNERLMIRVDWQNEWVDADSGESLPTGVMTASLSAPIEGSVEDCLRRLLDHASERAEMRYLMQTISESRKEQDNKRFY